MTDTERAARKRNPELFAAKRAPAKRNPVKTVILERGTTSDGFPVRLQQRGARFDVVRYSGVTWRYVDKAVSEDRAKNTFDALMLKPAKNPARTRASRRETAVNPASPTRRGLGYAVMAKNGIAASMVACFAQLRDAKQFAQAIADSTGMSFTIEPGAFTWTADQ